MGANLSSAFRGSALLTLLKELVMSLHDTDVTVKSYFGQKKIMDDESQ